MNWYKQAQIQKRTAQDYFDMMFPQAISEYWDAKNSKEFAKLTVEDYVSDLFRSMSEPFHALSDEEKEWIREELIKNLKKKFKIKS